MNQHHECLNLDKVLKLTEVISDFDDNEKENINNLLQNMAKIFKCDKIAFIQKSSEINTFDVISPSDVFQQELLYKNIYQSILTLSYSTKVPLLLNHTFEVHPDYKIENFAIISPVILHSEHIGCIFSSYATNSAGSHLFQNSDLSHYKLASNIISIQENSYRIKFNLETTNNYRKLLNMLSAKLISMKNEEMDAYIDECIKQTCEMWDIDRGYLFLVDFEKEKLNKTNEWCSKNVESLLEQERDIPFNVFPWDHIVHKFNIDPTSPIHIPNVIDASAVFESINFDSDSVDTPNIGESIDYLIKSKHLKSVLLIPISDNYDNDIFTLAILGFSQVKKEKEFPNKLIEMLKILSCYIAEAIKRRREFQNIARINQATLQNILKWEEESIEENIRFEKLETKMQAIFDDHAATINYSG